MVAALASLVLLAGCASAPQAPTSGTLDRSKGVLVGSITYETLSSYSISLKRLPDGAPQTVAAGPSPLSPIPVAHSDFDAVRGEVFALTLEPGEYEFHSWFVGSGRVKVGPAAPFSVRFTVAPGQAAYLGRFHFRSINRMGLAVSGASVTLFDAAAEDIPVAADKFGALKGVAIAGPARPGFRMANLGTGSQAHASSPPAMPVPPARR